MNQHQKAWGDTRIVPIACTFVFNQDGKLLLLQRHRQNLGGGQWGLPGGRIENDEDAKTAAQRELQEETGIVAPAVTFLGVHLVSMPHGTVQMATYQTTVPNDSPIIINPYEHHTHAWFALDSITEQKNILWGVPTTLYDFGFLKSLATDPTLADGSTATLLKVADVTMKI